MPLPFKRSNRGGDGPSSSSSSSSPSASSAVHSHSAADPASSLPKRNRLHVAIGRFDARSFAKAVSPPPAKLISLRSSNLNNSVINSNNVAVLLDVLQDEKAMQKRLKWAASAQVRLSWRHLTQQDEWENIPILQLMQAWSRTSFANLSQSAPPVKESELFATSAVNLALGLGGGSVQVATLSNTRGLSGNAVANSQPLNGSNGGAVIKRSSVDSTSTSSEDSLDEMFSVFLKFWACLPAKRVALHLNSSSIDCGVDSVPSLSRAGGPGAGSTGTNGVSGRAGGAIRTANVPRDEGRKALGSSSSPSNLLSVPGDSSSSGSSSLGSSLKKGVRTIRRRSNSHQKGDDSSTVANSVSGPGSSAGSSSSSPGAASDGSPYSDSLVTGSSSAAGGAATVPSRADRVDKFGHTVVHLACSSEEIAPAAIINLLRAGGPANCQGLCATVNHQRNTPLHHIFTKCREEEGLAQLVPLMIQTGANIHARNAQQETPLHKAVFSPLGIAAVKIAIAAGADVASRNSHGDTALHYCVQASRREVAQFLVENGASLHVQNNAGRTPLAEAIGRDLPINVDASSVLTPEERLSLSPVAKLLLQIEELRAWLAKFDLQELAHKFVSEEIFLESIPMITLEQLIALGIEKLGHRMSILRAAGELGATLSGESVAVAQFTATTASSGRRTAVSVFEPKKVAPPLLQHSGSDGQIRERSDKLRRVAAADQGSKADSHKSKTEKNKGTASSDAVIDKKQEGSDSDYDEYALDPALAGNEASQHESDEYIDLEFSAGGKGKTEQSAGDQMVLNRQFLADDDGYDDITISSLARAAEKTDLPFELAALSQPFALGKDNDDIDYNMTTAEGTTTAPNPNNIIISPNEHSLAASEYIDDESIEAEKPSGEDSSSKNVSAPAAPSSLLARQDSNIGAKWLINYSELTFKGELGKGAFGVVCKGIWRQQACAIKLAKTLDPQQEAAFRAEAELMMRLRPHTNVSTLLGITPAGQPLAIITEFYAKGSLLNVLRTEGRECNLPRETLLMIIRGSACGILHLHLEKLIHRDIASRNVLVAGDYNPKIADFGLSRFLGHINNDSAADAENSGQYTQSSTGPLRHMAPESLTKKKYSFASDSWAFGVLLFEIVTAGSQPYGNLSAVQAATQVATGEIRLELPSDKKQQWPQVADLMRRCFATLPNGRPDFSSIVQEVSEWT